MATIETGLEGVVTRVEKKEGRFGEFYNIGVDIVKREDSGFKVRTVRGTSKEALELNDRARVTLGNGRFESKVKIEKVIEKLKEM